MPPQFILDNQSLVYNLAYRVLGDPELAAAATEETFERVAQGLPRLRTAPKLWLLRTTITVCQGQVPGTPQSDPNAGDCGSLSRAHGTTSEPPEPQQARDVIQALLNALPPDQRVALVLSDVLGIRYREIADVTGVSFDVVRLRLSRGRAALRDIMLAQGRLLPGARP